MIIRFLIVYISLIQSVILGHNCCMFHCQKEQWFTKECNDPPSNCLIVMTLLGILSQALREGNQLIVVDHLASSAVLSAINHRTSSWIGSVLSIFSRVKIHSHQWFEALSSQIFTRLWRILRLMYIFRWISETNSVVRSVFVMIGFRLVFQWPDKMADQLKRGQLAVKRRLAWVFQNKQFFVQRTYGQFCGLNVKSHGLTKRGIRRMTHLNNASKLRWKYCWIYFRDIDCVVQTSSSDLRRLLFDPVKTAYFRK